MATTLFSQFASVGADLRRSVYQINADSIGQPFASRRAYYERQEAYYTNAIYERIDAEIAAYKARYGLSRYIRPIFNPTRRAVDWYPAHVYPPIPGQPNAIPFAPETPPELIAVVNAAFTWANWRAERYAYVRTGAMLGDAFIEIEVNSDRAKVYPRLIHPGFLTDAEWNATGDLISYTLQIPQYDNNRSYLWGKIVTKETITTLYDGQPRGYDGNDATMPNPWGFVPAVWVQHRNIGGQHGASAIDGVQGKIDEMNGLAAAANDFIGRLVEQGIVFKTDKPVSGLSAITGFGGSGSTHDAADPHAGRQRVRWLKGPADLQIDHLLNNIGLGDSNPHLDRLYREIEKDLPETVMDEQLRSMSQVTGPGAARMMGDVVGKLDEAASNYDAGLIKAAQMSVSIGAQLARAGAWGPRSQLSEAQRTFLAFAPESYDRGDLVFRLEPRPLFPLTEYERVQLAALKEAIKTPRGLLEAGYTLDEIYGEGNAPTVAPGLLAERETANTRVSELLGRAFDAGV